MVKDGSITEDHVDRMIRRIITPYLYFYQDRVDYPEPDPSMGYTFAAWSNALQYLPSPPPKIRDVRGDRDKFIRKLGAESTGLLKNVKSTLPLKAPSTIRVFGNDAGDPSQGLIVMRQYEIGTLPLGGGAGDVLWGDVNPSGRLPYSIVRDLKDYDIPIVNFTESDVTSPNAWQANFTEGQIIDYRRLDADGTKPLFEFGLGLSYTTFSTSKKPTVNKPVAPPSPKPDTSLAVQAGGNRELWTPIIRVKASISNAGSKAGSAVPQLYVSLPKDTTPKGTPERVLRGFEKVHLKPGQSREVTFELLRRDISFWDTTAQQWGLPKGKIKLAAGFSSRDLRAKTKLSLRLVN
ncbi:hypothetical protein CEP54_015592 [Fusarium duplospermum]|uniref:beta-glucosidase n=1 Tax=Fusarium duplospermum TaxID=1325734 RepID=A0A428NMW1_9HYPO|nr:hypothetical protein CEP54_015592 [Fusarium duplospermum]